MTPRARDRAAPRPWGEPCTRSPRAVFAFLAATAACVDAAPIALISGQIAAPDRPGQPEPAWVDVRAVSSDGALAASALVEPTTGAWTLALTVGGPWQLEVGVESARQNVLVIATDGQPLEVRVCAAQIEQLPTFLVRAPICSDGERCAQARTAVEMCLIEPPCAEADAAAEACLERATRACAAEESALFECRGRDPRSDCAREAQRLDDCLGVTPCDAELAARVRACDLPCAALRDSVVSLCDLGGDPCVPVGLFLESPSAGVELGCGTALSGGTP